MSGNSGHGPSAPAGWYADPDSDGALRYWDGTHWTDSGAPDDPDSMHVGSTASTAGDMPTSSGIPAAPLPLPPAAATSPPSSICAAATPSRGRQLIVVAAVVVAVLVVAVAVAAAVNSRRGSPLQAALDACRTTNPDWNSLDAQIGDGGDTLTVDGVGEDEGDTTQMMASFAAQECILAQISTPDSVRSRMGETRALDGQQTAQFDGYTVTWNYHPDSGMGLVITRT